MSFSSDMFLGPISAFIWFLSVNSGRIGFK